MEESNGLEKLGKKILHINCFDRMGGAEQFCFDLAENFGSNILVSKKFTSKSNVIILPFGNLDVGLQFFDRIKNKLGFKKRLRNLFAINDQWHFTWNILKNLECYKQCDVIHLHNIHGGYFDFKSILDIAKEKKIIWTLHDMWCITGGEAHVFENQGYMFGVGKTPYKHNYPLNGPWIENRTNWLARKKQIYKLVGSNLTMVPVSEWLEGCVKRSFVFNKELGIVKINNGFDAKIFTNRKKRIWIKPRVLIFNTPNPFKGCDAFTSLFKTSELQNIKSLFEIYTIGNKLGEENEFYLGQRVEKREKLSEIYNNVDILIYPSKAENFSLTLLEAVGCGLFVIGSNVGGNPEILKPNYSILFTDLKDLRSAFCFAIHNLQKIREMGNEGSTLIKEKYSIDSVSKKYEKLYVSLIYGN